MTLKCHPEELFKNYEEKTLYSLFRFLKFVKGIEILDVKGI